jgi:uncharacterized MAPEG superfamily protein
MLTCRSIFNVNARNYSIYTIPTAYLLAQLISTRGLFLASGLAHNVYPREDIGKASHHLPADKVACLKRQDAAHYNALENFPLFAASIVIGNEAGLDSGTLNTIGLGYLITRAVYAYLYVNVTTEKYSYFRYSVWELFRLMRTAAWWTGTIFCFYPLIKGANILAKF